MEYGIGNMATADEEDANLTMLYKNKKTYAVGHGCAASWKIVESKVQSINTEVIPTFEVPQSSFDIPELESDPVLEMYYLAGLADDDSILGSLTKFCSLYKNWIDKLKKRQENLPSEFASCAEKNINLCEEVFNRMTEGIEILKKDKVAYEAFLLTNKSMLMQSLQSKIQKTRRDPGDENISWADLSSEKVARSKKWRPFQLAFLLLSLKGMVDKNSVDRQLVDLIWFPTGGGKTEAYLGLSAFTIIYNRLKSPEMIFGTTIMMRYTLRLLTAQQFQRACTLICALEILRRADQEKLGREEISIGLWVGSASTPNTIEDAKRKLTDYISGASSAKPSPMLSCPWCGTRMFSERGRKQYAMRDKGRPKRIELYCPEASCPFNPNERLPIKFVDDDIYSSPPTLLFGTVDKFAQMPKREGVSSIFGLDGKGNGPELIIQDELHLISGALGTMVALYETAVDFLSSRKGKTPKIIASTATVRRASEQCMNLFGRKSRQFPAPGLEIEDSFFSKEDPQKPGRLYIGVMPSGKTQTTTSVRITAKLLQSVYELPFSDDVKDKYWTLVAYFNSIRELGGFISLVNDDIKQYANDLHLRHGHRMRAIMRHEELTSRKGAEEIPQILEHLSLAYKSEDSKGQQNYQDRPIDILEATNMISVGVDIDRFGLMLIRGQPKMTSEYIQVSSRIGRQNPGMVVILYNQARTRDRAHYERFVTYHSSFYRNVEPSSITPFSLPARIRALNAVLVTMIRHTADNGSLNKEKGVSGFSAELPGVREIKDFFLQRVKLIDPQEMAEIEEDINRSLQEWESFISARGENDRELVYANEKMGRPLLASSDKDRRPMGWIIPNSMRNVDAECNINIIDE